MKGEKMLIGLSYIDRKFIEESENDADYENLSIDSTSIKAHPHSAGAKKGG